MLKSFGAVCAAAIMTLSVPALAQPASAAAQAAPAAAGTLIAVAKADPELTTFVKLATAAGLDVTLAGTGPLTVLAPSNAAFAKLPAEQFAELSKPENAEQLQQVLLYHVIPASAPASAFKGTKGDVPSATPSMLSVDGTGDAVKINGATVIRADVTASNGVIHVVDAVLMPAASAAATTGAATPATN